MNHPAPRPPVASLLVAAAVLGVAAAPTHGADTGTMGATGRDFDVQTVNKLGSMNADFLCEHLFDSADPVAMAVELGTTFGPSYLTGKFGDLFGRQSAEQKQSYEKARVLARQKVWLPPAGERKVGEWMEQKYRSESLLVDPSTLPRSQRTRFDMAKSVLDGIVKALPADNPYTFTLAVSQADESNASASPGGFVYVTTGMLQDKTLDRNDIALRLSHEVAHVTRRHVLKEMQVKLVDAAEVAGDVKPLLAFTQEPGRVLDQLLGKMDAAQLMFQRFGQVQELEADACGTYLLMREPGVDAKGAVNRFVKPRQGTGSADSRSWDASHPAAEERELVMTAQIDPAMRSRVASLKTGNAKAPAAGTAAATNPSSRRSGETPSRTPTPAEAPAPAAPTEATNTAPSSNPIGSFMDRVKRALPAPASGAAPSPGREQN
jgi:hypothetical protein